MKRETESRGIFLNSMLVVYGLIWIVKLLSLILPSHFQFFYINGPSYVFDFVIFIFVTVGLIGILLWRKWGLYIVALGSFIGIFVVLVFYQTSNWLGHVAGLALPLLMIWAATRKWSIFK